MAAKIKLNSQEDPKLKIKPFLSDSSIYKNI